MTGPGDRDDLPPDWLDDIVIPDDARELDADAAALRRERRVARRRAFLRRIFIADGRRGPLVPLLVALLMISSLAVGMTFGLRSGTRPAHSAPLARAKVPAGHEQGNVPDVTLPEADGNLLALRGIRPAVILLFPDACPSCATLLQDVIDRTRDASINVVAVGHSGPPVLPGDAPGRVRAVIDRTSSLTAAFGVATDSPTAVFVQPNGLIHRIQPNAVPGAPITLEVYDIAR
ncbi:MAG: hypothetical protein ACJ73S_19820 [Mycobacteriales bacterium]